MASKKTSAGKDPKRVLAGLKAAATRRRNNIVKQAIAEGKNPKRVLAAKLAWEKRKLQGLAPTKPAKKVKKKAKGKAPRKPRSKTPLADKLEELVNRPMSELMKTRPEKEIWRHPMPTSSDILDINLLLMQEYKKRLSAVEEGADLLDVIEQHVTDVTKSTDVIQREQIAIMRAVEAKLPRAWVESDESKILKRMYEAAELGVESREASDLADELDWDEHDVWTLYYQSMTP